MNNMKYLALFIMSTLFTQCGLFIDDDSLSLPLRPYTGNQLRIDGYYYRIADGTDFAEGTIFDCYFFYENGIVLCRGTSGGFIEDMDISAINNQNYKRGLLKTHHSSKSVNTHDTPWIFRLYSVSLRHEKV